MDGEWRHAIRIENWFMAQLGEHDLLLPDELTRIPGLLWLWFELLDQKNRVLAGNWAVAEVTGQPVLPDGAQVIALDSFSSAQWSGGEVERGEYAGRVELLAGRGHGFFEFLLTPPPHSRGMTLLGELSSARPGPGVPQTDQDVYPTEVCVMLGDEEVQRVVLGNQYADARGSLSHMHGFAGRYGEPMRIEIPAEIVRKAALRGGREVRLRLLVPEDSRPAGGLTIYGARAGRYPCGLTVLWHK
jgi:hypothetical protein